MTNQKPTAKLLSTIFDEFRMTRLLPSLTAGLVNGIITITVVVAFSMLVFSGHLAEFLPLSIGFFLFGQILIATVTAMFSSFKGIVSGLQDSPMAIFTLITASIVNKTPSSTPEQRFYTVVIFMAITTIATGLVFWLLGRFKLGKFVRYIPYPVIGGFLAGTGMLIMFGGISVMADVPASLTQFAWLTQTSLYLKWMPGLVFAMALILVLRRYSHFLVLPGLLLGSIGLFYLILIVTNTSILQANAMGLLPSAFKDIGGGLWKPIGPLELQSVNWGIISQVAGDMVAVVIISIIAILLNITGIEIATGEDIDLNRELQVGGIANILSGLVGSGIGYHVIGESVLTHKINAKGRLPGIFLAIICAGVLLFGGGLFSYFPTALLGGFLLFIGIDFLVTWLYDGWFKFPSIDYIIIIVIMLVINLVGILEGVGVGLFLTIFFFVVQYSRINPVKHKLSGASFRSNVVRPHLYQKLLQQKGDWLYILELQGFIYFGSANELFNCIQSRIHQDDTLLPKYILLDFRSVTGLDTSAIFSFEKLKQMTDKKEIILIFTHLTTKIQKQLSQMFKSDDEYIKIYPDMDRGVEWCEDQIIATLESVGFGARPETMIKQLEKALTRPEEISAFMNYFKRMEINEGEVIIQQGDPPHGLFFVEKGQVSVCLESNNGDVIRIRKMGTGTVVGELGVFLGTPATASIIADQPGTCYFLSIENIHKMQKENPFLSNEFFKFMVGLLSERLVQTTYVLQSMAG